MSKVFLLTPAQGLSGVKEKVIETVEQAGPQPLSAHHPGRGRGRHL